MFSYIFSIFQILVMVNACIALVISHFFGAVVMGVFLSELQ